MPDRSRFRSIGMPRTRGGITIGPETKETKTLAQLRADAKNYARYVMFLYRAREADLERAPASHLNQPRDSETRALRQHSVTGGINSCVNTSQLNAMLWQGQISQAEAEAVNQAFVGKLAQFFSEPHRLQYSNQLARVGNPSIAERYEVVVPGIASTYFDIEFSGEDMAKVALSELLRGSVLTLSTLEHTVLAVGYKDLDVRDIGSAALWICDPLNPSVISPRKLSSFRKTSILVPALTDPIRSVGRELIGGW